MLVLTRKKNQQIIIAEGEITITVLEIRGDKVRLGIDAPRDIPINREEVQAAIVRAEQDANQQAIAASA